MSANRAGSLRRAAWAVTVAAVAVLLTGCHILQPLGPPVPRGATILGGSIVPPPPPPPGWKLVIETPTSQQQAQDTVLGYLQQTINALPAETVFDASRYGGAGSTAPCTDDPRVTDPPADFATSHGVTLPPGFDNATFIARVGEIWESWGWWVYERDGMYKPNRAGLPPNGYELFIEVPAVPGPPHISGTSPCFPRHLVRRDLPFPRTITSGE